MDGQTGGGPEDRGHVSVTQIARKPCDVIDLIPQFPNGDASEQTSSHGTPTPTYTVHTTKGGGNKKKKKTRRR
jgi:hypothetical protein